MAEAKIDINVNKAGLVNSAKSAAQAAGDVLQDTIEKALDGVLDGLEKQAKELDLPFNRENFRENASAGLLDLTKSSKWKRGLGESSRQITASIARGAAVGLSDKEVERALTKVHERGAAAGLKKLAEKPHGIVGGAAIGAHAGTAHAGTAHATGHPGILSRLFFGQHGAEAGAKHVGGHLMHGAGGTLAQFGEAGEAVEHTAMVPFGKVGLLGGLGLAGAGLAAYGGMKAVGYAKEMEGLGLKLLPGMGIGSGIEGAGGLHRAMGSGLTRGGGVFTHQETAAQLESLGRVGAVPALGAVRRAERGLGLGDELTQLLGAQAGQGAAITGARGKQESIKVVAAGVASGLAQGRWGEIARGMSQMITGRGVGATADTGGITQALGSIGGAYKGNAAFEVLRNIEGLFSGGKSDLGRALAFQQAGLGTSVEQGGVGGDIYAAKRKMELGVFGKSSRFRRGAKGEVEEYEVGPGAEGGGFQDRLMEMVSRYRETVGGGYAGPLGTAGKAGTAEEIQRGQIVDVLAGQMGTTANTVEKLFSAIEAGTGTQKTIAKIMEEGASLEEQAFKAMIGMADFKALDAKFDTLVGKLEHLLAPLIHKTVDVLSSLLDAVNRLMEILPGSHAAEKQSTKVADRATHELLSGKYDASAVFEDVHAKLKSREESIGKATSLSESLDKMEQRKGIARQQAVLEHVQKTGTFPAHGASAQDLIAKGVSANTAAKFLGSEGVTDKEISSVRSMLVDVMDKHRKDLREDLKGMKSAPSINVSVESGMQVKHDALNERSNAAPNTPFGAVGAAH